MPSPVPAGTGAGGGSTRWEVRFSHRGPVFVPLPSFFSSSIFGSVEVKNLDPDKVNSLTVLLVAKATDTWTVRDDSSSAAAQCSVGHPLVLHQWIQDAAPQDATHRTLPTRRCHRTLPTRHCPTGRCPQDTTHRTPPTGHCWLDSS
ncbi:hypothetical protein NFI96_013937, partial [Prochilodus magdalenae]